MARLFGTDGVRGLANDTLSPHLALQLGAAAAEVLAAHAMNGTDHPHVVVGRDPRVSGEMLEAALAAGISSRGVDVDLLGGFLLLPWLLKQHGVMLLLGL